MMDDRKMSDKKVIIDQFISLDDECQMINMPLYYIVMEWSEAFDEDKPDALDSTTLYAVSAGDKNEAVNAIIKAVRTELKGECNIEVAEKAEDLIDKAMDNDLIVVADGEAEVFWLQE